MIGNKNQSEANELGEPESVAPYAIAPIIKKFRAKRPRLTHVPIANKIAAAIVSSRRGRNVKTRAAKNVNDAIPAPMFAAWAKGFISIGRLQVT